MVPLVNSAPLALAFLFQRLKWPIPMSRWRTAKEIRDLLNDPVTRSSATDALLQYLNNCKTESEVCEILTIIFLTLPAGRPTRAALALRIQCPSILADMILERTLGIGRGIGGWGQTHSGPAPVDFDGGSYFHKHKAAHVPPSLSRSLRKLERESGKRFLQQWAYEWKVLSDTLGTRFTDYPYYFDDVLEVRSGIIDQYWQQMREVYLSAYLRTLAFAVREWHLPQRIAEAYCLNCVYGIAGLFDVEPSTRPAWLANYPEKFCDSGLEWKPLIRDLLKDAQENRMKLVSLDTPIASSLKKYARLKLSAHLVTTDYEPPDEAVLHEMMPRLMLEDAFELNGQPVDIAICEADNAGRSGKEAAVCNGLFPMPFGAWQGDYFATGVTIPASYAVPGAEIRCTNKSIDLVASGGKVVSRTQIWNDDWTPQYPRNGSTRCAVATMIDVDALAAAETRLSRRLAWFARLTAWDRKKEYGDYFESQRTSIVLD